MTQRGRKRPLAVPLRLLGSGRLAWSASVAAADFAEADTREPSAGQPAPQPGGLRIGDAEVPEAGRVEVDVLLERIGGGISVSGRISADWQAPCARCWAPVEGTASAAVTEIFTADPREGEQYQLGTEEVDLAPMVREAVLLELPVHAVRCAVGRPCADLAEFTFAGAESDEPTGAASGAAEEQDRLGDPRWAALDVLRGRDETRAAPSQESA